MIYYFYTMPIRVLLYEDNEHLRLSLQSLLQWQPDIDLAAAMPNAETVLTDLKEYRPDVVLMDIDMPGVTGIEALHQIRTKDALLPVIMLTIFDDNEHIIEAIAAGASGYLLKKNFDQIVASIKDVLNGGAPMTSSIARQVLQLFPKTPKAGEDTDHLLSARETQLLELLVKGYSYKMIADQLNISMGTVCSHIKKIYRKLQVNSATEAIYQAMSRKLV